MRLDERAEARMTRFAEAARGIARDLARSDEEQALQGLSQELRSKADIRINSEFAPFASERPVVRQPKKGAVAKKTGKGAGVTKPAVGKSKAPGKTPAPVKTKKPASTAGRGKK